MNVSYKKLWKLLIDKDMMKKDLQKEAGISWATLTKMSKGEVVSTEVLMKVCKVLHCDVGTPLCCHNFALWCHSALLWCHIAPI